MKIRFLYCEGPHDVEFITKTIQCHELAVIDKRVLSDLPKPLDMLTIKAFQSVDIENIRLDKPSGSFIPSKLLKENNSDVYYLVYSIGGKYRLKDAFNSVRMSTLLAKKIDDLDIENYFILDADYENMKHGGRDATLSYIKDQATEHLNENMVPSEGKFTSDSYEIYYYILADEHENEGTLEDIMSGMIKHDQVFERAQMYCDEISSMAETITKLKISDVTKKQKAVLTTYSQVFNPSYSLAVGISSKEVIDESKMLKSTQCVSLIDCLTND